MATEEQTNSDVKEVSAHALMLSDDEFEFLNKMNAITIMEYEGKQFPVLNLTAIIKKHIHEIQVMAQMLAMHKQAIELLILHTGMENVH